MVILTDMLGGTPSNLAISVMDGGRVEVICGVNLPMLIKLATMRESAELDHAVVEARDAGRRSSRCEQGPGGEVTQGQFGRRLPAAAATDGLSREMPS